MTSPSFKIIEFIFSVQTNLKLYHWKTTSYSSHKAMDELLESFLATSDRFVENYIAKYGRKILDLSGSSSIKLYSVEDSTVVPFITHSIQFLTSSKHLKLNPDDLDLLTIRDEMVEALNKARYLCTLH